MNNDFAIVIDVNSELTKEMQEKYNIDLVLGHYVMPDGSEHQSFLSWDEISRDEFYSALKKNPNGYKTSPPNIQEFYEAFEKYAKVGKSILAISISKAISGNIDFMNGAKSEILKKYPDAHIEIIDSMRFGPGFALIAINASILREQGYSFEEVVKWVNENKNRFHQCGWMDDLSFVAKKGRITNAKAFFGTLVGVKPIGEFDYNGLTTVIGKAKGEKQAYRVLLKYMENTIENASEQVILIATSNRNKEAEAYANMIKEKFNPKELYINDIYSNCGINVGPGLMAAYYMGKPISADLSFEKNLMNDILSEDKK